MSFYFDSWIPLVTILISLLTGVVIFALPERKEKFRLWVNLAGAFIHLGLVAWMVWGAFHDHNYEAVIPLAGGLEIFFRADALSMLLASLSAVLWLVTTIYAIGYLKGTKNQARFFGFFSLCVTSVSGLTLSNNLFTFFIFYEFLTFATYPLVIHKGSEKALKAGKLYLRYTLIGGLSVFFAIVWLYSLTGPFNFTEGGVLSSMDLENTWALTIIFFMLVLGIGVKAALVPFHGWLPNAMVAPAPVSALLHAVAVVKVGAFGIVRIVYDVYGVTYASDLNLTIPLGILAGFTIIYGSIRALYQDDLKKRLAFSTVSQVSYIILGVAIAGPIATVGGLVHLVHQGIMKITLFFSAGNYAETLSITKVSQMDGVAKRMPWTSAAFSVGAMGMIGVPPLAGFISKWYLGIGALNANQPYYVLVLLVSSLLNAMYFLPIIYRMWFKPARESDSGWEEKIKRGRLETAWMLLLPPVLTAILVVLSGVFANFPYSPLNWVELITQREYLP